jgi:DNA-binding MarR family transcriptional regulator
MEINDTVSYVLSRVSNAFRTALERNMIGIGLHAGQVFVLMELWKQDGQRQVDLAERLNVSTPTVNKMVTGMVEAGLVTNVRLPGDARSSRIFLTQNGKSARENVESQWHELEEFVVAGLTDAERLILFELLTKMKSLNNTGEDEE